MLDLNRAQKRLEQLQQTRRDYSRISYRLQEGQNVLRFITKPGQTWPFKNGALYYNIRKPFFVSPKELYDEPDPILQQLEELMNTKDEENVAFARQHFPTRRTFALAVVRGQQEKGAVWIAMPLRIEQELVGYITNEDYGDITDPQTGRDFTITKIKGNPFPQYLVQPKGKPTALADSKEKIEEILNNTPDFKEAFKHYTYEEMEEIWEKYLTGQKNSTNQDEEEEVDEEPIEEEKTDIAATLAAFKKKKLKSQK